MHIAPFDNANQPIVDVDDPLVPLVYFNIVRLAAGASFPYRVAGYETCIVPATGTVTVETAGQTFAQIGNRGADVWDGEPEGVYIPTDTAAQITALTDCEVFIAGAQFSETLKPFPCAPLISTLSNMAATTPRRIARSNISLVPHTTTAWVACWCLNSIPLAQAAGRAFPATNTTPTVCPMKPGMTNVTISALNPITDRACKCCNASIMNRAMPITS